MILLTVQAFAINRLAGIPYPVWSKYKSEESCLSVGLICSLRGARPGGIHI